MSLDKETVARVATLARIKVADEDLAPLAGELNQILGWIEQLNAVDTGDIEPMARVVNMKLPMREDVVTEANRQQAVLANGPNATAEFFTVPKVVE
jgi:aspartyl-tRNA(Asn)/glutamyl-tRNA(Gln) amidotransferase subunit C